MMNIETWQVTTATERELVMTREFDAPRASVQGLHIVVSDLQAARAQLLERGVAVSEVKTSAAGSRSSSSRIRTAMAGRCSISLLEPAGQTHRPNGNPR